MVIVISLRTKGKSGKVFIALSISSGKKMGYQIRIWQKKR